MSSITNFKRIKTYISAFFLIFFYLFNFTLFSPQTFATDSVIVPQRVGIAQIVDHPALDATRRGIEDTLKQHPNIQIIFESAQGSIATATLIVQKMIGQKVDVIVAIGTPVAQAALNAVKGTKIPIVFASITDPKGSDLLQNLDQPEGQITGSSNLTPLLPQIELFQKIQPRIQNYGIIYNPGEPNGVAMAKQVDQTLKSLKLKCTHATAAHSSQVAAAAQSLVGKVDAIFITNDNTALSAFESIVKIATAAKIPVFVSDVDMVQKGAVAALGPNQYQVGVDAGQTVLKLLDGTSVAQCPVTYPSQVEMYLNQSQASKININLTSNILNRAVQVF